MVHPMHMNTEEHQQATVVTFDGTALNPSKHLLTVTLNSQEIITQRDCLSIIIIIIIFIIFLINLFI